MLCGFNGYSAQIESVIQHYLSYICITILMSLDFFIGVAEKTSSIIFFFKYNGIYIFQSFYKNKNLKYCIELMFFNNSKLKRHCSEQIILSVLEK